MSEFEDKLNSILGNPEAMAQVMNLAQSLNLGGGGGEPEGVTLCIHAQGLHLCTG